MKQLSVLSIDWDVFHDMTQFMPGAMSCQIDWVVEYSRWEGEFKHTYKFAYEEFELLKRYLHGLNQPVYIAEDHGRLYHLIEENTECALVNLDFHSDATECQGLDRLACGNWMSALAQYKGVKVSTDWRQLHSKGVYGLPEDESLIDMWHAIGFNGVFEREYDLVFLCQSFDFSPPHMNHRFRELVDACPDARVLPGDMPYYPTYSECHQNACFSDYVYVPTGKEAPEEMDRIHDDEDLYVIWPVSQIRYLPDCDPEFRK